MLLSGFTLAWIYAVSNANPEDGYPVHDSVDRVIGKILPKIIASGLDPAPLKPVNIRIKSTWLPTFMADITNSSVSGLSLLRRKEPCDIQNDPKGDNRATAFCRLSTCSMEASLKASIKGDRLLDGSRDIGIKITLALPKVVVVLERDSAGKFSMVGIFVDSFLQAVTLDGKLELNKARKEEFFESLRKNMEEQLDSIVASRYADFFRDELRRFNSLGSA